MENSNTQGFSFDLPKGNSSIIKVIGVGGGGNNALKHMYERGIHGVDFVVCNTDAQTLDNNPVSNKVQLGITMTEGLGAGADPEVGEKAAIESMDEIKAALGQNTKMVFITAGMGGGTGTGAAPVIAKIAKEAGILTIGIVTVPFSFEGKRRLDQAEIGLEKLRNNVDSLIVINNDKLRQQFGNLGFKQGFSKADEVLTNAAKGMAEVITGYFDVNIDFRDAKSVLQNSGTALMSTGTASGENKAEEAVKKALDSPLLNDNKITGAKNVLLLIRSGAEEVTMDEIGVIMDHIQKEAGNTADIIFGVGTDEELGEAVSVLVIATGFAKEDKKNTGHTEKIKYTLNDSPRNTSSINADFNATHEKSEMGNLMEEKNLLKLDEDDEVLFPPTFQEKKEILQERKERFSEDNKQKINTSEDTFQELSLFSFEEEELESESFTFEVEEKREKPQSNLFEDSKGGSLFSEEKPIEFNFFVNEPINEPIAEIQERVKELMPETVQKKEETPELISEIPLPEENIEETTEEGFTFISKKSLTKDAKVEERRNKLQEFNSRYQMGDGESDFETIPAFKRKNITIDGLEASQQQINTFYSENEKGQVQIRENKFLNKDVD